MSGTPSSDCAVASFKHGQQHKRVSQLSDLSYTSSLPGYAQANSSAAFPPNPPNYPFSTPSTVDAPATPPASHYSPSESASSVCQTAGLRGRKESLIESSKAKRQRSVILRQARHRKHSLASHGETARDSQEDQEGEADGALLFGTELDLLIGQTSSILLAGNECLSGVIDAREQLRKFQALDSALDHGVVKQEQDLRDRLDSANALQDSMNSLVKSVDDFFGDAEQSGSTSVPYTKPITLPSRLSSAASPSHSLLKPAQASTPDVFSDTPEMASLPEAGPSRRLRSLAEEGTEESQASRPSINHTASKVSHDTVDGSPSPSTSSLAKGIYSSLFGSSSDPPAAKTSSPQAKDLLSKFAKPPSSPSISITATPPVSGSALPPSTSFESPISSTLSSSNKHAASSSLLSTPNHSFHKSPAPSSVLTTPSTATSSSGPYTPDRDRPPFSQLDSPAHLLGARESQQRPSLRPSHHRASSNLSASSEAVPKADFQHAKGSIRHVSSPLPAPPQADGEEEAREDDWQVVAKDDSAQGRLRGLLFANK